VASPAAISPLVAQIPTGVSRMLPIARGISEGGESGAFCAAKESKSLFHYTNAAGMDGILQSNKLMPSLKSLNPRDVRYGNG
jgi:hypothetical protein